MIDKLVCPHWISQMGCNSLLDIHHDHYHECNLIHPEFVDYSDANRPGCNNEHIPCKICCWRWAFFSRCDHGHECHKMHKTAVEVTRLFYARHPYNGPGLKYKVATAELFRTARLVTEEMLENSRASVQTPDRDDFPISKGDYVAWRNEHVWALKRTRRLPAHEVQHWMKRNVGPEQADNRSPVPGPPMPHTVPPAGFTRPSNPQHLSALTQAAIRHQQSRPFLAAEPEVEEIQRPPDFIPITRQQATKTPPPLLDPANRPKAPPMFGTAKSPPGPEHLAAARKAPPVVEVKAPPRPWITGTQPMTGLTSIAEEEVEPKAPPIFERAQPQAPPPPPPIELKAPPMTKQPAPPLPLPQSVEPPPPPTREIRRTRTMEVLHEGQFIHRLRDGPETTFDLAMVSVNNNTSERDLPKYVMLQALMQSTMQTAVGTTHDQHERLRLLHGWCQQRDDRLRNSSPDLIQCQRHYSFAEVQVLYYFIQKITDLDLRRRLSHTPFVNTDGTMRKPQNRHELNHESDDDVAITIMDT